MLNYKLHCFRHKVKIADRKVSYVGFYELKLTSPSFIDLQFEFNKDGFRLVSMSYNANETNYKVQFMVKTSATCSPEDNFDETLGLRIAESRAEMKASIKVLNTLAKFSDKLDDVIFDIVESNYKLTGRSISNFRHVKTLTK